MKISEGIVLAVGICMIGVFGRCESYESHGYVRKNIDATRPALHDDRQFITIWIHGISLFSPNKGDIGLMHFDQLTKNRGLRNLGQMLSEYAPDKFPAEHTYAYSWAGSFNYHACEEAACKLYWSLKDLVGQYKNTYGHKPKIRLITFSYGGNIALNMAKVKDAQKLDIEELLMLGYPVVKGISKLTHDPMFKRIFNLYAILDIVQLIDPQGFICPFASCPMFTTRCLKGNGNLIQAKTRINGHSFGHFGFIGRQFISALAHVLDGLNEIADSKQHAQHCQKMVTYLLNVYTKEKALPRYMKSCK